MSPLDLFLGDVGLSGPADAFPKQNHVESYVRSNGVPKSFFLICGSAALLFILPASLPAAELAGEGTPVRKLQRGFLNVALSPLDISHEMAKEKGVDSFIPSWFSGAGRGVCFMAGRALAGIYEMVTFPVPWPANFEPLVEPEFAWEHLEKKHSAQGIAHSVKNKKGSDSFNF